ncbi:MAG: IgGFc-binding protein, partial [Paludibacteraceae bacterium]|nr:IgGFc-binding protein [Paludibacteraceae bacterium]
MPRIIGARPSDVTLQVTVVVTAKEQVTAVLKNMAGSFAGRIRIPEGGGYRELTLPNNMAYLYEDDAVSARGFEISSEDGKTPFSCFVFVQSGVLGNSARDAALVIPYKSLGREYLVQTFPNDGKSTEIAIVSTQRNTTIVIIPSTETSSGVPARTPMVRRLPESRSIMISSKQKVKDSSDTLDLSGSIICADKPIAVFEANEAVNIPNGESYSNDFAFEQLPPINSLGNKFLFSRPSEHIKNLECCVTALYDNTVVTEKRYSEESGKVSTVTTTLSALQSLAKRPVLTDKINNIVIETSQPALCYAYMPSSSYNSEDVFDSSDNLIATYTWGDPANAMVVPWDHQVNDITFFTRKLETKADDELQCHYVMVNVPKSDVGLLQLDGTPVNSSLFKPYGGDPNMMYAHLPLIEYDKKMHQLTTTGAGFTGYVYGMSQSGTGYMYTLGYRLDLLRDSLYITDTENYMSIMSYDLERMKYGWYQRQFDDFPLENQRRDTAVICDNSTLNFAVDIDHTFDSVIWQVDKLNKGKLEKTVIREDFPFANFHKWSHKFIVDEDKHLEASKRDRSTIYQVHAIMHHPCTVCPEDFPIYDTLTTIVRVYRSYDDTIPRVICDGESTDFFSDKSYVAVPQYSELGLPKERKTTTFIGDASVKGEVKVDDQTYRLGLGKHYFKRKYVTAFGCDSTVTFAVFVCNIPPAVTLPDRVLTHENPTISFNDGDNTFFNGKKISKPGIYTDHLKSRGCNCGDIVDPDFQGCDSTVILRVHLRDTLIQSFCDRTSNPELYGVDWKDFVWTGHTKTNPDVADQVAVGETKRFYDCYTTNDGLDSCYTLILTHEPTTVKEFEETIPNGFSYSWEYSDGEITRTMEIDPGFSETKTFNARINYENGCPMLFHLTLTWKETDTDIKEKTVCENDTIMYRGKIFAGSKWRDKYPNATFVPFAERGLGRTQIKVETVDTESATVEYWIGLTVNPVYEAHDVLYLCDNEVIEYNGEFFAGSKAVTALPITMRLNQPVTEYTRNIGSKLGCDSVCYAVFNMSETYNFVQYDTICSNDQDYVWTDHSDKGHTLYDTSTGQRINFGYGELWNKDTPGTTFVIADSLHTANCANCRKHWCDSVYVLNLTVLPSYLIYDDIDLSEEDVFQCGDITYGGPKATQPYDQVIDHDQVLTCNYTLRTGTHECDSIMVHNIRFGNVFRDTTYVFVGGGEEYTWHRTMSDGTDKAVCTLTAEGGKTLYCYDIYKTVLNFDSIYVLALVGAPSYSFQETDTVCQADGTYDWTGHMGADNNLRINGLPIKEISLRESGLLTVTDRLVSIVTHKDPHGGVPTTTYADSIYTLKLYVAPTYNDYFNRKTVVADDTLCSNDTYIWERTLYVGADYDETVYPIDATSPYYDDIVRLAPSDMDADGFYNQVIPMTTVLNCDSVLHLRLKFNTVAQTHITPRIGDNDTTWTFGHGNNKHTGKEYLVEDYTDETRTIREYSYVDTLQTAAGCDSIVHCDLTVLPTYLFWDPEDKTCTTVKYDWRAEYTNKFLDINLVRKDYFYDTLTSVQFGADSIRALHLIHIPGYLESSEKQLCKDQELQWHGLTLKYTPDNEGDLYVNYEQRFTGIDDCDSLYQVKVQYFDVYSYPVEEDQVCRYQPYHWMSEDGIEHTNGLRDEKGKKLKSIPTDTTGWIVIYDSLSTTTCRCDSVYTLRLFVNDARLESDTVTICSDATYTWHKNNQTYSVDADTLIRDTVVIPNETGCNDSSFLYLKINKAYHFEEDSVVLCGFELPYTWPGHEDRIDISPKEAEKWTTDRIFDLWDRNQTTLGCDSNYHQPVRVMPEQYTILYDTICLGDTLYFRNHVLTQTISVTDEDKNIYGCDSNITMNLEVIPPTKFAVVDQPVVCADALTFDINFASDGMPAIAYCVLYDEHAHEQNFVDVEWTAISKT